MPCAHTRAAVIARNLADHVRGRRTRLITLTIRHSAQPLTEQVRKLYRSFRKLRRRQPSAALFRGGLAILELHHTGQANGWHPHLHVLAEGDFVEQRELAADWHAITRDSYVVHVTAVRNDTNAIRYVTKYATKPLAKSAAHTPALIAEALLALKGRRLLIPFGTWQHVRFTDPPQDDREWEILGPLDLLLSQERHGNTIAVAALSALRAQRPWRRKTRPPPGMTFAGQPLERILPWTGIREPDQR